MIDHISIGVGDVSKAREFYKAALAPLGYQVLMEFDDGVFSMGAPGPNGADPGGELWFGVDPEPKPMHLAFAAAGQAQVEAFYEAGIEAGGTDNGAPGERPHYHPGYYAAFVLDPNGHNIEAVCHDWKSA